MSAWGQMHLLDGFQLGDLPFLEAGLFSHQFL